MYVEQIAQQLGNLPIQIIYLSNGQIAFQLMQQILTIIDQCHKTKKILSVISSQNIIVSSEIFEYNKAYVLTETLKKWLKTLNLLSPI